MTGPVKDGFSEGLSGFLMLPSLDRFEPNCGVNGKPVNNVAIAFTCHPLMSFPASPVELLIHCLPFPKGSSQVADMVDWLVTLKADGPQSLLRALRSITIWAWF